MVKIWLVLAMLLLPGVGNAQKVVGSMAAGENTSLNITNAIYLTARNTIIGIVDSSSTIYLSNNFTGATYYVWRVAHSFNTSALPINASVDSVKLYLYPTALDTTGTGGFRIWVTSGTFTGGVATGWFNDFAGWAASGAYSLTDFAETPVMSKNIALNDTLVVKFNTTGNAAVDIVNGRTRIMLVHGSDATASQPTAYSYMGFTLAAAHIVVWWSIRSTTTRTVLSSNGASTPLKSNGVVSPLK